MAATPTSLSEGTQATTVGATPDTLFTTVAAGVSQLQIDTTNLAAGEQLVLIATQKILTAGSQKQVWSVSVTGPQIDTVVVSPPVACPYAVVWKINQKNGSTRNIPWIVVGY